MTAVLFDRSVRLGGLVLVLLLAGGTCVFAQTSQRPYRSLFGASASGSDPSNDWFMLTMTEAYDQDVLGDVNAPLQSALQQGGLFTELTGEMNYRATGRRVDFAATAGSTFRYYGEQQQVVGVGHHVGVGATIGLSSSTSLKLNQTVAYAPSYLYGLFANIATPQLGQVNVGTNYAVNNAPSYNYGSSATVTEQVGLRSTFAAHVSGQYTDFVQPSQPPVGVTPFRNLLSYEAGGLFTQGISRDVRINLGYTFRRAEYFNGAFPSEHDLNVGVQYDHPLSRTRRTYLRFNTGSVLLQAPVPGDTANVLRPQYRVAGDAALGTQFGRTWQAEGGYRRGVSFIEGISTPVLTDGVTASSSGLLTPRTNLLLTAAYSVGQPTVLNASHGITTYTADARTSVAVNRTWAFFVEYLYYFYDFSAGIVPAGAPARVSRNSVRTGLMLWLPMGGVERVAR